MKRRALISLVLLALLVQPAAAGPVSPPTRAAAAGSGPLRFVHAQFDAGLVWPNAVAVSPDGLHAYAVAVFDNDLSVWRRHPDSGTLSFIERFRDGDGIDGLDDARSVAVSPDGSSVYVAGHQDDSLVVFGREPGTGRLTYLEIHEDGVAGVNGLNGAQTVLVSSDDLHVYVCSRASDAVALFDRNPSTGLLSYKTYYLDGSGDVEGLFGAHGLALSPDGNHLYATGEYDDAITVFERSPTTGYLTFAEVHTDSDPGVDGLDGAASVAVSADGANVYVASIDESAIAVFERSPTTGRLTFVEAHKDGVGVVDGLDRARSITISADGAYVYATGSGTDHAVAIFSRDPGNGSLGYEGIVQDSVGGVYGLRNPYYMALGPSDGHLYVPARSPGALVVFRRDPGTGMLDLTEVEPSGDGLEGAVGMAAVGRCLYVAGNNDNAVASLRGDVVSGRLAYQGEQDNWSIEGLEGARAVAVTSDGRHAYVAGHDDDAVAVLDVFPTCEAPEFRMAYTDGVDGVVGLQGPQDLKLSPNDAHLYVASEQSDAVVTFRRDSVTGELEYVDMLEDDVDADGLDGAFALAVSPDGKNLYVAGHFDSAVVVLGRNPATGRLSYRHHIADGDGGADWLKGASGVAVSPDGAHVYVAGRTDNAVVIFERAGSSGGDLTYVGDVRDGIGGVDGLAGARAVAVSPDGRQVYVVGQDDDALAVFGRDPSTGGLTYLGVLRDGVDGVEGIATANGLALSPAGDYIYVSGYDSDAVAVFARTLVRLPLVQRS
jgi:6-phosphogluconolactonase (cycloisomerase 2 family)